MNNNGLSQDFVSINGIKVSSSQIAAFYIVYKVFQEKIISIKEKYNPPSNDTYICPKKNYEFRPHTLYILPHSLPDFYKSVYPNLLSTIDKYRSNSCVTMVVPINYYRDESVKNIQDFIRLLNDTDRLFWLWLPHDNDNGGFSWTGYNVDNIDNRHIFSDKFIGRFFLKDTGIDNMIELFTRLLQNFVTYIM